MAQKNTIDQNLLWLHYGASFKLSEHYSFNQMIMERSYISPWRQHHFILQSHLGRQLGNGWSAYAGFSYFVLSTPQDATIKDFENKIELWPQIEINKKHKLFQIINVTHRYRMDFRFFRPNDKNFSYRNTRLRYRFKLNLPISKTFDITFYDEILVNHTNDLIPNFFDQNRLSFGFLAKVSQSISMGMDYVNWYQQTPSEVTYFNRHIINFNFFNRFDLANK